jgi:hypothetical protein
VTTSFQNGIDGVPSDKNRTELVSGNKTLTAADSGKTFLVSGGTSIFSLPAWVPGVVYTFAFIGNDGGGQIQVSPSSAQSIAAGGVASVADKDLIMASATIKRGDYVTLIGGWGGAGGGTTTHYITQQRGIVTKEA